MEAQEISLFLLLVLSSLVFLPIVIRLGGGRHIDVFEPVYPLAGFYFLLFVIQPLILIATRSDLASETAFWLTLLYSAVGLIAFYAGYYSRLGWGIAGQIPTPSETYSVRRVSAVVLLFTCISLGAMLGLGYRVSREASISWAFANPLQFNNRFLKAGSGYHVLGISLLQAGFFLLDAFSLRSRQLGLRLIALLYLAGVLLVYMPLGARWLLLVTFVVPVVVRHYYLGRSVRLFHVLMLLPALVVAFGWLGAYRATGSPLPQVGSLERFLVGTLSGDLLTPFDNFVHLVRALNDDSVGLQYGRYYLYLLIAPIPTSLWPEKPIVSIEWAFTEAVFGTDPRYGPTRTMTIPGELYFNFHLPGIIAGMFMWGVFWRTMYAWVLKNHRNLGVVLVYACTLATGFNSLRTSLQTFILSTSAGVVPIALASWYIAGGRLGRSPRGIAPIHRTRFPWTPDNRGGRHGRRGDSGGYSATSAGEPVVRSQEG